MKHYVLGEGFRKLHMPFLGEIMPEELVVIERSAEVGEDFSLETLHRVCSRSSRVAIVVDEAETRRPDWHKRYVEAGVRLFCVLLPMTRADDLAPHWETARAAPIMERTAAIHRYNLVRDTLPAEFPLVVMLQPDAGALNVIGPTLFHFGEKGVPWIIVDPRRLSVEKDGAKLRSVFEWLRVKGFRTPLFFHYEFNPMAWNAHTKNIFRGPRRVDIDVANTCTHNCRFCGLYGPDAAAELKRRSGGRLPPEITRMMSLRIDPEVCLKLIADLPDTLFYLQFGGLGDPFTHPDMMRFIRAARRRGFPVEVLTNFAYMTDEMIDELHTFGGRHTEMSFIVNLSAATAKTYSEVRPNQRGEVFERVLRSLQRATRLRARNGGVGIAITLMSVVNRHNYHEMPAFVSLGKELEVSRVWLKPMEVHGDMHLATLPTKEQRADYRVKARESLEIADRHGVTLVGRAQLEAMSFQ